MTTARLFATTLVSLAIAVASLHSPRADAQDAPNANDNYAGMLDYLANSRIDGRAFAGANGAIAANLAAGDHNLQANLRSFASGDTAAASVSAAQQHTNDQYDSPLHAAASIGGEAFNQASGLVSINQASGSGNAELNVVAVMLANQGIRETTDGNLFLVASASAGGQTSQDPGVAKAGTRSVAVESTALQGFEGVLQLNQIAGSGNATYNQLGLSVQGTP